MVRSPSVNNPGQDSSKSELSVMLGITIPDNWPVDVIGKIVTVHIEATSTELTGPSLVESMDITVKVIETCSLEVSTQTKVSVDSGGSSSHFWMYSTLATSPRPSVSLSRRNQIHSLSKKNTNIAKAYNLETPYLRRFNCRQTRQPLLEGK